MSDPMSLFGSGVQLLSAVYVLVGEFVGARDEVKLLSVQSELLTKLLEAQAKFGEAQQAVIEQNGVLDALQKKVRALEEQQFQKHRYRLCNLGARGGRGDFFAYEPRPASEVPENAGEVAHFLCQPCFDTGQRVVLAGNGDGYWQCPVCKTGAQTTPAQIVFHGRSEDDPRYRGFL